MSFATPAWTISWAIGFQDAIAIGVKKAVNCPFVWWSDSIFAAAGTPAGNANPYGDRSTVVGDLARAGGVDLHVEPVGSEDPLDPRVVEEGLLLRTDHAADDRLPDRRIRRRRGRAALAARDGGEDRDRDADGEEARQPERQTPFHAAVVPPGEHCTRPDVNGR